MCDLQYPNFQRRPLTDHGGRSRAPIAGGCAILFGLPFAAVGAFVLLFMAGLLPLESEGTDAPPLILGAFGTVFGAAGLFLILHGFSTTLRSAQAKRRRKVHPMEPWLWDHSWDTRKASTTEFRGFFKGVLFMVLFAAFMTPFNWWAFASGESNFIIIGIVSLFDLLWLVCLGAVVYHLMRSLKYGNSTLLFAGFPYYLGEDLSARLTRAGRLHRFRTLEIILRCVEDAIEQTTDSEGDRASTVRSYVLYEDRQLFTPDELPIAKGSELPISFPLPDKAPGTNLAEHPPRYWELEVKADTPGIDYGAVFLLPVYSRSQAFDWMDQV